MTWSDEAKAQDHKEAAERHESYAATTESRTRKYAEQQANARYREADRKKS